MIFTSTTYGFFLAFVFGLYWLKTNRLWQNGVFLLASYLFYGWVHPWFSALVLISTLLDFYCGLAMSRWRIQAKAFLLASLVGNLGLLILFKYFNFFVTNAEELLSVLGVRVNVAALNVIMPLGISFYTFQSLSYTIDVYRKRLSPCRSLLNYSCFVASFPQILSGPIERASHMLPQFSCPRQWCWKRFCSVWPLMLSGILKKLVIADNIAPYVDKIFMLDGPPLLLLFVGGIGFSIQLFADFSAYTDIARASARLFGLDLVENFRAPYLAVNPSDFWRRWHISLSNWIRDYLYIPLGGSRVRSRLRFAFVILTTMTICGLWHGPAWNYVVWGFFHGLLLLGYHLIKKVGPRRSKRGGGLVFSWLVMQCMVIFGWILFRTESLGWLVHTIAEASLGLSGEPIVVACTLLLTFAAYCIPWALLVFLEKRGLRRYWLVWGYRWAQVVLIALLANPNPQQFIYLQF